MGVHDGPEYAPESDILTIGIGKVCSVRHIHGGEMYSEVISFSLVQRKARFTRPSY